MKSEWTTMRCADFIDFNPRLTLKKGTVATKIAMDKLRPFTKKIPESEQAAFSGGAKFANGDTIMARITPCLENGKTAFVDCLAEGEIAFGSTEFIVLRAKKGVSDARFLYYLATSSNFRDVAIKSMVGTSGRQRVQQGVLEACELRVPPLETQRKIAAILSALDDKIELNRRINANLEQLLSVVYQAWFRDFTQVKTARKVETQYGAIPVGWRWELLGNLCESVSKTHRFNKRELIFLNTGDIENGQFLHSNYSQVEDMPGQAKKTIAQGDVLYSEIRPINRHFAYVNFPADDYVVSTKLMVLRTKGLDSRRLYHFLTREETLTELQTQAESRSGTFPQIRFDNVGKLPILIADDKTEAQFIDLLHTSYAQIDRNNLENTKLAAVRDALLPRLMAGEIDVSDVSL